MGSNFPPSSSFLSRIFWSSHVFSASSFSKWQGAASSPRFAPVNLPSTPKSLARVRSRRLIRLACFSLRARVQRGIIGIFSDFDRDFLASKWRFCQRLSLPLAHELRHYSISIGFLRKKNDVKEPIPSATSVVLLLYFKVIFVSILDFHFNYWMHSLYITFVRKEKEN